MPFGMVDWLGPRMRQVNGGGDRPMGRGNFGGGYGSSRCKQWGLCCIVVQKCMRRLSWHWGVEWEGPRHWCVHLCLCM